MGRVLRTLTGITFVCGVLIPAGTATAGSVGSTHDYTCGGNGNLLPAPQTSITASAPTEVLPGSTFTIDNIGFGFHFWTPLSYQGTFAVSGATPATLDAWL